MSQVFKKILKSFFIVLVFGSIVYVYASVTDGTINDTNKSALLCRDDTCTTTTQINFKPTRGEAVHVTDAGLTGNVWSETFGWINLSPTNGGVENTSTGVLSGFAWGENSGWINFKPTNGGVTIGTDGKFSGHAWAQNYGWIKFDCEILNACVETDWRPASERSTGGGGSSDPTPETPSTDESELDIDACPNIEGKQNLIPEGLVIDKSGNCIEPLQCNQVDGDMKQSLDVVIVLDQSSSMADDNKMVEAKLAANAFINNLVPGSDRVSYVSFANSSTLQSGLSASFNTTKNRINNTTTTGTTNIGGAIKTAYGELNRNSRSNVKKVIILLTDGKANISDSPLTSPNNYALAEAYKAKADGIMLYTVGLGNDVDSNFLRSLSTDTDYYYFAPMGDVLTDIYLQIAAIECTSKPSNVSDYVYIDSNNNGVKDSGDKGLEGATLVLSATEGDLPTRIVTTDSDGKFNFENVVDGKYLLCYKSNEGESQVFPSSDSCYEVVVIQGVNVLGTYFLISGINEVIEEEIKKEDDIEEFPDVPLDIDVCPNILGEQNIIPEGLVISSRNECILPIQCNLIDGDMKQPLDVVIAIDRSGSMLDNQKLIKAKQAANSFIDNLLPGSDRVSYVTFSDSGVLSTGFSSSFANTKNKINATTANGYTNAGGAIKASYKEISNNGRSNVKKVIIVLTDGQTNISDVKNVSPVNYAFDEATKAKTDGVVIYTIGLGSDVDANFLKKVASSTKHYFYAPTGDDLTNIYLDIAAIECTAAPSNIYDYVYLDTNNNFIKDNSDKKLSGVDLLLTPTNALLTSREVKTDNNGKFLFEDVIGGEYSLCASWEEDLHQSFPKTDCYRIVVIQGLDTLGTYFLLSSEVPPIPPLSEEDNPINSDVEGDTGEKDITDSIKDFIDNILPDFGGEEDNVIDDTIIAVIDDVVKVTDDVKDFFENILNNENGDGKLFVITQVDVDGIVNSIRDQVKGMESIADTISDVSDFMKTETGEIGTNVVTTVGVVTGAYVSIATSMFANPISMRELFLIPSRLWGLLLALFGIKRKNLPWGTVYDSVTKQPLDPAYVVLQDLAGNEVSTCITDLDGRYGFLVPPGKYKMIANKTNYSFPSKKLFGRSQDELYQELYFSEEFEVKEGEVISKNIPLDPIKFDWNEFAKKEKKLMRFFSKRDIWVARISDILFALGFIITVIALSVTPNTYNIIVFIFYVVMFLFKRTILKPRPFGNVKRSTTDDPLSFAIIRVFFAGSEREIIHKVTDKTGKYYCLIPNGSYYVKIENKNDDESYSLVYTSEVIDVDKGFINKKFRV